LRELAGYQRAVVAAEGAIGVSGQCAGTADVEALLNGNIRACGRSREIDAGNPCVRGVPDGQIRVEREPGIKDVFVERCRRQEERSPESEIATPRDLAARWRGPFETNLEAEISAVADRPDRSEFGAVMKWRAFRIERGGALPLGVRGRGCVDTAIKWFCNAQCRA
jgi:hypothetical protein